MDRLKYYAVVDDGDVPRLLSSTGEIPDGVTLIADDDLLIELANCGGDEARDECASLIRQRCGRG